MENEIRLINLREAMKVLSLSRSKLYEMVANQQIPYVRFDRHIKFCVSDIQKFIEEKKVVDFKCNFDILNLKGKNYRKK